MNENEKLFRALGGIGDDLIAKADEPVTKTGDKVWYRIAALAACAAFVIGVGALVLPKMSFGAKTAAPAAAEAPMAEGAIEQESKAEEAMPEEPKTAASSEEAGGSEPAEEPKKEETPVSKPIKEEPPKSEPEEEEEPKDEEPEEDAPDPEPLRNLDLFDQKYHFVSKTQSDSRNEVFTDDEKIGKWYTELFSGEQVYRYGTDTVTGTDGSQYPFQCVVIYGRTAAIYEYSEQQAPPAAEETPAEETPAE